MNNFISAFSFYEFLRVLMPGAYALVAAKDFMNLWELDSKIFEDQSYNTLLSLVLIFLIGLFIYAWDFPKMLKGFQTDLPTNRIKEICELDENEINNSYFTFYNNTSDENKLKTEKYSGFFHLSVNLSVVSLTILIGGFVNYFFGNWSAFQIVNMIILAISVLTTYLIYSKRLKFAFQRHLSQYLVSKEYKMLIEKNK